MRISLALLCVAAVGCGSGPQGTASVNGSVAGVSLTAKDALFGSFVTNGVRDDAVLVTSYDKACDRSRDNASVPSATTLMLTLRQTDGSGARVAFTPGAFPIGAGPDAERSAVAVFQTFDASCGTTLEAPADTASGGTVTLSALDASFADGTFDVHFPAGAHLTGTFHAVLCAEPTDPAKPTCAALQRVAQSPRVSVQAEPAEGTR